MDYFAWSNDYFRESEVLKTRIERDYKRMKSAGREEQIELRRKLSVLRSMYYELKLTAQHLYNRGVGVG